MAAAPHSAPSSDRPRNSSLTDAQLLDILARADRGETAAQIGRAHGKSRAAILGVMKRLRDEYAASEAGGC